MVSWCLYGVQGKASTCLSVNKSNQLSKILYVHRLKIGARGVYVILRFIFPERTARVQLESPCNNWILTHWQICTHILIGDDFDVLNMSSSLKNLP